LQAGGGGVMVWGMFSWHTLGPLALFLTMSTPLWPPCTYLLMAISSRIMHHVTKLVSFQIEHDNEHLWDVVEMELCALDVHPTNLHQLLDAILSVWANISQECFQ